MCWGCPCHTRMWREAKPVVFSRAMHFEMLVSKWFWAIVWHMNCSCKVYCWVARSEVTTRRLPTNSWNINYLLLQRDLNDGCSWPTWVHVGAWAPPLWYMFELIPFKAKLAVSNGFGSRTTKVFFFLFLWKKWSKKPVNLTKKPSVNVWFVYNNCQTFGHFKFEFWHGMRRTAFVDFHHSKLKDRYGDGTTFE